MAHAFNSVSNCNASSAFPAGTNTWSWKCAAIILAGIPLAASLFEDIDFDDFRENFEKSETMDEFLKGIPLYLIKEDNLGFLGALEVSRNAKNES